jgi:ketosteroid isomerase-like protein
MKIDPSKTWRRVEARLARESDPRRREILETVLAHMKAEAEGDLEGLMATVAEDAAYHAWGAEDAFMSPQGKEAVRQFYGAFVGAGTQRLEFDVDRLLVDEDGVLTEGVMRIAYPGNLLRLMGHAADDADAFYLFEARMAIVWPMDADAKVLGEDSYVAGDGFEGILNRKLAPEDLA